MTTCFAFYQHKVGLNCSSGGTSVCSVDGTAINGIEDGECVNDRCTYPCLDEFLGIGVDAWCSNNSCNDGNRYCDPP